MQNKKQSKAKTIKRLLKYVTKGYKFQLVVVLVSIIISALVSKYYNKCISWSFRSTVYKIPNR